MNNFTGSFETTLTDVQQYITYGCCEETCNLKYKTKNYVTEVEYNLSSDDTIICEFGTSKNNYYVFEINYFSGRYFNKYYKLLYERFGSQTDLFGTITETFDGKTSSIIKNCTLEHIRNAHFYTIKELFICIQQIVENYKEKTAYYCSLHNESFSSDTYEKYIHNVACKLILNSGYYKDTIPSISDEKEQVEFVNNPREFCSFLLKNDSHPI